MRIKTFFADGTPCGRAAFADRFLLRLRGMLGRRFERFDAMLIIPCGQIHTVGMKYAIDVVYLNSAGRVIGIERNLKPGTVCRRVQNAHSVLELPAGNASFHRMQTGTQISFTA